MENEISISINAGVDVETSSASCIGSTQNIISDKERKSFGIEDKNLKAIIGKILEKNPNIAYLCSPAPNLSDKFDLYTKYERPQVTTVLVAEEAKVIGITSEPTIVATKIFKNSSSKKGTFNCGISEEVNDTFESNWSNTDAISVKQSVNYGVQFCGIGVKGETSFAYKHTWGKGGSSSKSLTLGSESGIEIELEPGESVEATLSAHRGTLKIRIAYKAYLIGDAIAVYEKEYKDHYYHNLDIKDVMKAGSIANELHFSEDIAVGYYTNSTVELKDMLGNLRASFTPSIARSNTL